MIPGTWGSRPVLLKGLEFLPQLETSQVRNDLNTPYSTCSGPEPHLREQEMNLRILMGPVYFQSNGFKLPLRTPPSFFTQRWFLYPPDQEPHFHPNRTTLSWVTETYPNLPESEAPLECTIRPGEVRPDDDLNQTRVKFSDSVLRVGG